jgi:hypothetical protein
LSEPQAPAADSRRLGSIALVVLLVASLALGVLVYRARTPDLALEVTSFPKSFKGEEVAEMVFFVRFDDEDATVEIVGRDQVVVRTLADPIPLSAEEEVQCLWDGLDDVGEEAPPGRYRLRVTLPSEGRTMVFPKRLDIEPGIGTPERTGSVGVVDPPCAPLERSA